MRSSKSRSRNKSRNQRSLGNVVNRVFDSSGPEGKVRGTPQQIIEKYLALARDAQLSNDRVAEQSFLQHAEHYTRMLGEAQREQAERQAQFGGQNGFDDQGDRQNDRGQGDRGQGDRNQGDRNQGDRSQNDRNQNDRGDRGNWQNQQGDRPERGDRGERNDRQDRRRDERRDDRREDRAPAAAEADAAETLPDFLRAPARPPAGADRGIPEALPVDDDGGPVDTPESREAVDDLTDPMPSHAADAEPAGDAAAEIAETPEAAPVPRQRKPRATAAPGAAPRRAATPRKRSTEPAADPGPAD